MIAGYLTYGSIDASPGGSYLQPKPIHKNRIEPRLGVEPKTSSLPRMRSTSELSRRKHSLPPTQGNGAVPPNFESAARGEGIEPPSTGLESVVIPLDQPRLFTPLGHLPFWGSLRRWDRTTNLLVQSQMFFRLNYPQTL